ncbi:MAG: cell division protein FtsA, partial [Patescibacteria group bacterium]
MSSNFVTGLDVGTSSLKVALIENCDGKPMLKTVFKEPSLGLRKGVIVDIAEVSQSINRVFHEVKKISKSALKNVYVS